MKKRKKKNQFRRPEQPANTHFENLIELRECNPLGYARLDDASHQAVVKYETERLANTFEHREGMERLLDLRKRLPGVFASFSNETKLMVEKYAERKRAYEIVNRSKER